MPPRTIQPERTLVEIDPFVLGSFQVSAYVVTDGGEALVIDAPEGSQRLVAFLKERGQTPRTLVNTHGHGDHVFANTLLKREWPEIEIACGREEAPLLADARQNLSLLFGMEVTSPPPDRLLDEGDTVTVGETAFQVLATPGHSPGSLSLYCPEGPDGPGVVFTGDALFAGSIGRTDFPGMSHARLVESIREKLLALPPETVVYPGHGPATTIGREAETNPFL